MSFMSFVLTACCFVLLVSISETHLISFLCVSGFRDVRCNIERAEIFVSSN